MSPPALQMNPTLGSPVESVRISGTSTGQVRTGEAQLLSAPAASASPQATPASPAAPAAPAAPTGAGPAAAPAGAAPAAPAPGPSSAIDSPQAEPVAGGPADLQPVSAARSARRPWMLPISHSALQGSAWWSRPSPRPAASAGSSRIVRRRAAAQSAGDPFQGAINEFVQYPLDARSRRIG
jgi:hypothetical protein